MRPLVYHSVALRDVFFITLGVAAVTELAIQIGARSGGERDPSYVWMLAGSFAGIGLAFAAVGVGDRLPGPAWLSAITGIALMWAGYVLRVWSVRTLGQFFTVEVTVDSEQTLVDTGPYAIMRHPSYTGLLVLYLGLGIALDSYLSVAAALFIPLAAVLNRIDHEERMLRREMGEPYRAYSARTARLIPGVW
jgi:protein-S-isoprenylcysteine O-methyltransferase Ste14